MDPPNSDCDGHSPPVFSFFFKFQPNAGVVSSPCHRLCPVPTERRGPLAFFVAEDVMMNQPEGPEDRGPANRRSASHSGWTGGDGCGRSCEAGAGDVMRLFEVKYPVICTNDPPLGYSLDRVNQPLLVHNCITSCRLHIAAGQKHQLERML